MKLSLKIALAVFFILPLISSCGKGGYSAPAPAFAPSYIAMDEAGSPAYGRTMAAAAPAEMPMEPREAASGIPVPASGGEISPQAQTRKLVKTAELSLRVDDPEASEKPVADLLEKYDAWTASTGIYQNSRNYTIRVPYDFYDTMLTELGSLGRILRRTENAEDVTLRYYDLEGRLATRRELLKTYQEYLGKAESIDEVMTVESRIADLQHEIDWTGTEFRNLANLVDYSTINLEINGPVSSDSFSAPTPGERFAELFGSFGDVLSSALVVLLGILIYGVPAILVVILLFYILFGRIGLLKKLWRAAGGKRAVSANIREGNPNGRKPYSNTGADQGTPGNSGSKRNRHGRYNRHKSGDIS